MGSSRLRKTSSICDACTSCVITVIWMKCKLDCYLYTYICICSQPHGDLRGVQKINVRMRSRASWLELRFAVMMPITVCVRVVSVVDMRRWKCQSSCTDGERSWIKAVCAYVVARTNPLYTVDYRTIQCTFLAYHVYTYMCAQTCVT